MSDDPMDDTIKRVWDEIKSRNMKAYDGVMGNPESWVPASFRHEFGMIRNRLLETHSHDDLRKFIAEREFQEIDDVKNTESETPPVYRPFTPATIWREISFLTWLKAAVDLGPEKGLALLTDSNHGALAIRGGKFRPGRKPGTGGPIRKAIAKLLQKCPTMKNAAIWESLKMKPPRGYTLFDNRQGKYIENAKGITVQHYARFCNVVSDEKAKLKG